VIVFSLCRRCWHTGNNSDEPLDPFPFLGGRWTKRRPGFRLIYCWPGLDRGSLPLTFRLWYSHICAEKGCLALTNYRPGVKRKYRWVRTVLVVVVEYGSIFHVSLFLLCSGVLLSNLLCCLPFNTCYYLIFVRIFRPHCLHTVYKMRPVHIDCTHSMVCVSCLSLCVLSTGVSCEKNGWTDWDAVWWSDSCQFKEPLLDEGQDQMNSFAAIGVDRMAIPPFAKLL